MKRLFVTFCLLASNSLFAQTFPVQNLQVNGNAALGGNITASGGSVSGLSISGGTITGTPVSGSSGAFTTLSASTTNPSLTFTASGSGSVARSYASKMGDVVNAVDFGADPTGTNDSEAAAALAIAALPSGGTVDFPKGTFKFNATLPNATSNITIRCAELGTTIQPGASMTSLISNTANNFAVQGCNLVNQSSFATNGILSTLSSGNAGISAWIRDNFIVGFTNGISASGQNYTISRNFLQNNTTAILFTNDGRNTSIDTNYVLGGATGVKLGITSQQAEGTRIINNTILATSGSGSGIELDAGLADVIMGNIIDQTGTSSPGIVANPGSNNVAKLHIIGNWIAAGQNSYSVFLGSNTADISLISNDIVSNNALAATAGISASSTNGLKIISNTFGIVTGPDLSLSGVVNQTILGNTSSQGGSNALGTTINGANGVTCTGSPTGSFATVAGLVTHC